MSASFGLYRLQQLDTQIDQAQSRLEVIHQTLENDEEMRQVTARLTDAKTRRHEADLALRTREAEVQAQRTKIEQSEGSLYGGSVRNPKELQDLQNEIAALKRHLATLEDKQLEAMLESESAEEAHKDAQTDHELVLARLAAQNRDLMQEISKLEHDLARLQTERQAATSAIPATVRSQYEDLRQTRRGVALTTISDNSCDACGTTLTAALQQAARSPAQIALCPTCGRILYAG